MPNTVREDILTDIETAIEGITTGNGFDNTISNVQRWMGNGNSLATLPAVIVKAGPETRSERANPLTECRMGVELILFISVAEDDTTATDTRLNSLLGDITKKLLTDRRRNGKAVDTEITEVIPFDSIEGQPECGLIITAQVYYRTQQTDPKTAA